MQNLVDGAVVQLESARTSFDDQTLLDVDLLTLIMLADARNDTLDLLCE